MSRSRPRRDAGAGEPPTAQLANQVALPRAPGEREVGDPAVDAAQVVDHFFFTFALTADDTTLRAPVDVAPAPE